METRAARNQDREKRMEQSLDQIIERLNYDIDLDNRVNPFPRQYDAAKTVRHMHPNVCPASQQASNSGSNPPGR